MFTRSTPFFGFIITFFIWEVRLKSVHKKGKKCVQCRTRRDKNVQNKTGDQNADYCNHLQPDNLKIQYLCPFPAGSQAMLGYYIASLCNNRRRRRRIISKQKSAYECKHSRHSYCLLIAWLVTQTPQFQLFFSCEILVNSMFLLFYLPRNTLYFLYFSKK